MVARVDRHLRETILGVIPFYKVFHMKLGRWEESMRFRQSEDQKEFTFVHVIK